MTECRILTTLAHGYLVPYPEELTPAGLLILLDYRLNDYPRNAQGMFDETADYDEWLAEYLYNCEIELTEEQQKIYDYIAISHNASSWLGQLAGYYHASYISRPFYNYSEGFEMTLDIDSLKPACEDFDSYEDFIDKYDPDEREGLPTKLQYIMEDYGWHLNQEKEREDFAKYWPGIEKMSYANLLLGTDGPNIEPGDAGWRVYLAMILKRIPDRADRMRALHEFADNYRDARYQ